MDKTQAIKKIRTLVPKASVRVYDTQSSPERREAALADAEELSAQRDEVLADIKRREDAAGITHLKQEAHTLYQAAQRARSLGRYRRIEVLRPVMGGLANEIVATGDGFGEVIEKIQARRNGGAQ